MSRYLIQTAHQSNYPNPIEFRQGDRLTLGKCDDEYPGWVWTTTADGNEGWAPLALMDITVDGNQAEATQAYTALELNTEVGDIVEIQRQLNDWAWVVRADGEAGWVPFATLKKWPTVDVGQQNKTGSWPKGN